MNSVKGAGVIISEQGVDYSWRREEEGGGGGALTAPIYRELTGEEEKGGGGLWLMGSPPKNGSRSGGRL